MAEVATVRTTLTLVPDVPWEQADPAWFCSHCASSLPPRATRARVCGECGLGLILSTRCRLVPDRDGAFLVIDGSLSVCAVSRTAERLLEVTETQAVNRHLTTFLVPANDGQAGARDLAIAVARAVRGLPDAQRVAVRAANTFGIRRSAMVGSCGPQPAALVVLQ